MASRSGLHVRAERPSQGGDGGASDGLVGVLSFAVVGCNQERERTN